MRGTDFQSPLSALVWGQYEVLKVAAVWPHRQPPATILSLRTATERDADYPHRGAVRGWLRANCACLTEEINNAYVYRETDLRAWSQEASRLKRKHMCKRHPKVIPRSSQSDPKVVQTLSHSDPKVIPN